MCVRSDSIQRNETIELALERLANEHGYSGAISVSQEGEVLLLSHMSGVQEIYIVPNRRFEIQKLKAEQRSLLSYLVCLPRLFRPGEGWSYSSTGYILMGYIMEKVTGASFAALLRCAVLGPLAMVNTGLDLPRRINPGRAYGHTVEDGQFVNAEDDDMQRHRAAAPGLSSRPITGDRSSG